MNLNWIWTHLLSLTACCLFSSLQRVTTDQWVLTSPTSSKKGNRSGRKSLECLTCGFKWCDRHCLTGMQNINLVAWFHSLPCLQLAWWMLRSVSLMRMYYWHHYERTTHWEARLLGAKQFVFRVKTLARSWRFVRGASIYDIYICIYTYLYIYIYIYIYIYMCV